MGTEAPELPLVLVRGTGYDPNTYDPELYRQQLEYLWLDALSKPANWVEDISTPPSPYGEGGGAPAQAEPLDEVLVTAPDLTDEEPPIDDMTNEELLKYGTDTTLEELDRRFGTGGYVGPGYPYDPYGSYTPPVGFDPRVDTFPSERRYSPSPYERLPQAPPRPTPPALPPVESPWWEPALGLGRLLLGGAALLFPQPMGPRELDELPYKPPRPAPPPLPVEFFPIEMPGILLPEIEFAPEPATRTAPAPLTPGFLEPITDPDWWELPDVIGQPGYEPIPGPGLAPGQRPGPGGDPRMRPYPERDPYPFGSPFGYPLGDPFGLPENEVFPEPRTPEPIPPRPIGQPFTPVPGTALDPSPYLSPFPFDPFSPQVAAPDEADSCDCGSGGGKKKKKSKKKPREECYRGTYIETSKSLKKIRKEKIQCQ